MNNHPPRLGAVSADTAEAAEQVPFSPLQKLTQQVIDGIDTRFDSLYRQGVLKTDDRETVFRHIRSLFRSLEVANVSGQAEPDAPLDIDVPAEALFSEIKFFLHHAGLTRLITWNNWSISRSNEEQRMLGFRRGRLPRFCAYLYRTCEERGALPETDQPLFIVRKGAGDGRHTDDIALDPQIQALSNVQVIGIADKIYFNPYDLLRRFLRPEVLKNDDFMEFFKKVLTPAVRTRFREYYYKGEGVWMDDWSETDDIPPDNNLLYALLRDLPELLQPHILEGKDTKVAGSGEFENDTEEQLGRGAYYLFLQAQVLPYHEIQMRMRIYDMNLHARLKSALQREKIKPLRENLTKLDRLHNTRNPTPDDIQALRRSVAKVCQVDRSELPEDLSNLSVYVLGKIKEYESESQHHHRAFRSRKRTEIDQSRLVLDPLAPGYSHLEPGDRHKLEGIINEILQRNERLAELEAQYQKLMVEIGSITKQLSFLRGHLEQPNILAQVRALDETRVKETATALAQKKGETGKPRGLGRKQKAHQAAVAEYTAHINRLRTAIAKGLGLPFSTLKTKEKEELCSLLERKKNELEPIAKRRRSQLQAIGSQIKEQKRNVEALEVFGKGLLAVPEDSEDAGQMWRPAGLQRRHYQASVRFLRQFFRLDFLAGVASDQPFEAGYDNRIAKAPDLNAAYIIGNPKRFLVERFVDANEHISDGSVLFMESVRSDSHETDAEFLQDIRDNIRKLAPGGVLITDGIYQSYTRIFRGRDVYETLFGDDVVAQSQFQVWFGEQGQGRKPGRILIQRAYPDGSFSVAEWPEEPELTEVFRRKMTWHPADHTLSRLDVEYRNRALRVLLAASAGGSDARIFERHNASHNRIKTIVKQILLSYFQTRLGLDKKKNRRRVGCPHDEEKDIKKWLWDIIRTGQNHILGFPEGADLSELQFNLMLECKRLLEECDQAVAVGRIVPEVGPVGRKEFPPGAVYMADKLQTFPRLSQEVAPKTFSGDIVQQCAVRETPETADNLERKIGQFKLNIETLYELGIETPFSQLLFTDCATNHSLQLATQRLLGEDWCDQFVSFLRLDMRSRRFSRQYRQTLTQLKKAFEAGVLTVGGSWETVTNLLKGDLSSPGEVFYQQIKDPLLCAIQDPETPFAYGGICIGYQILCRAIAEQYQALVPTAGVFPAELEFGPCPVVFLGREENPLKNHLPPIITQAQTHGDHQCDVHLIPGVTPLARSAVTGRVVALEFENAIGVQWHPEVGSEFGVKRLMVEMRNRANPLNEFWGIRPRDLCHQWELARGISSHGGDHVLTNMWLPLSERVFARLGETPPKYSPA